MRSLRRLANIYVVLFLSQFLLVFSYENNYYNQNVNSKQDSDSMESFLENENNFYGRNFAYGYANKENQIIGESSELGNNGEERNFYDVRRDPANEELKYENENDGIMEKSRAYEDSSEDELMVVGEEDSPRDELLKRAKRYLSLNHVNLAAYTPANPFYSYNYNYNPNIPSTTDFNSQSYKNSGSTFSSTNSKNMESLLSSCQLTNLILYRAVNQMNDNKLNDQNPHYSRAIQHVPLAIGTFGALLEKNGNYPKHPSQPNPVKVQTSQPLQTYITTHSFLTTVTSTEILRQDLTLSTRVRTYAFSTSKVHTLFFTKDIAPSSVVENFHSTVTPASAAPESVSIKKPSRGTRVINETVNSFGDSRRLKRKDENIRIESSEIESSEEKFSGDDDYEPYQYGRPNRCPQLNSNSVITTTTETMTATVIKTVTKYFNPTSASSVSRPNVSSRLITNKLSNKVDKSVRRVPLRPVGRLFTYRLV